MKRICEFGIMLRIIKIFENIMKMFAKYDFSYQTLLLSLCKINDSLESHTKDQIQYTDRMKLYDTEANFTKFTGNVLLLINKKKIRNPK